jgi:DNA-binding transcriptional regulator YiaG
MAHQPLAKYLEATREQGRRTPTGPAKVLLRIAARHPEVLLEVA